jgi:hypothetical protein
MLGDPGLLVRDVLGVQHVAGTFRFPRCSRDPAAFAPGGGGEPAMKRGQTLWPTSSVPFGWCLRQMDQISGACRSISAYRACWSLSLTRVTRVSDRRVITHRVSVLPGGRTGPRLAAAMKVICQPGAPSAATA